MALIEALVIYALLMFFLTVGKLPNLKDLPAPTAVTATAPTTAAGMPAAR
jgi:hypothetical protein